MFFATKPAGGRDGRPIRCGSVCARGLLIGKHDVAVQVGGEQYPQRIRSEQDGCGFADRITFDQVVNDEYVERQDVDHTEQRISQVEEQVAPDEIREQLNAEKTDQKVSLRSAGKVNQSGGYAHAQVKDSPRDGKYDIRRRQRRFAQGRIPFADGIGLDQSGEVAQQQANQYRNGECENFFHKSPVETGRRCNYRATAVAASGQKRANGEPLPATAGFAKRLFARLMKKPPGITRGGF